MREVTAPHWPQELSQLIGVLRVGLGLKDIESAVPTIDNALIDFAQKRHRIGPFLARIARDNPEIVLDCEASDRLEAIASSNQKKRLRQLAAIKKVSDLLRGAGIEFWLFKGEDLAIQLYANPNDRFSKDIDLLIKPADAAQALDLLQQHGYHQNNAGKPAQGRTLSQRRLGMVLDKDQTLRDPQFNQQIELHQRFFRFEPNGLTAELRRGWSPRIQVPAHNTGMLLYLLIHGALDRWNRLKWLVDLSLLARGLEHDQLDELLVLARRFNCEDAVLASLNWIEMVFPGSLPKHVAPQMASRVNDSPAAQRLIAEFEASLTAATRYRPKRSDLLTSPTPAWNVFKGVRHKASLALQIPIAAILRRY